MAKKNTTSHKSKSKARKNVLERINPNAAGIDIGANFHLVAIPEDRAEENVRKFGPFRSDLHRLADWLTEHHIETVAMESTGVYWIPVFQILEQRGFEVKLVNAAHVKNLPGRKSDVSDCQWLQQLHTFGLLNGSFRPKDDVCVLRALLRFRDTLVKDCSSHVLRMQKALTEMNVQIHRVLSDITGYSGMAIIRAILAGERDALKLAQMKHPQVKASTLSTLAVEVIISETGLDMNCWRSEKHFCSWLKVCPDNRISGGKLLGSRPRKTKNRAAAMFRLAANQRCKAIPPSEHLSVASKPDWVHQQP